MALMLGEIIQRVRWRMGDSSQQIFQNQEIVGLANDWLRELAKLIPQGFWTTTTFSTVASTRLYNIASNATRIQRVYYNKSYPLPQVGEIELSQLTPDFTTTGTPQVYYIQRTPAEGTSQIEMSLGFWPVPSASSVEIRYFYEYVPASVTALVSRMPVPPGMDSSCIPYICWHLKEHDREPGEASAMKQEYEQGIVMLRQQLVANPDRRWQMASDQAWPIRGFARLDPSVYEKP